MDLDLLNRTLEITENPGLETTDERLDEIATLIQNGDYLEAAARAQAVLEEDIYDVRVLGAFFYGVFLGQGIQAVQPIIHTLIQLLQENLAAFGPPARKEKQMQTALRWFVNQLLKKLQYEENSGSSVYQEWLRSVSAEEVLAMLQAIDELKPVLGAALEDASTPLLDGFGKIGQWLGSFQKLVYQAEQEQEAEPAAEPQEDQPNFPDQETREPGAPPPASRLHDSAQDLPAAEGSYHLQVLIRKMEAFSRLIEEEKFPLAALVADDINEIIANFDPKLYFPKLFSRYLQQLAINIGELSSYEENKGSPEWEVMKEFYKVNLDGFMEL